MRLLKWFFFLVLFCIHCHRPLLLLCLTHIYIFFGKSRLLRLAILLPDRKATKAIFEREEGYFLHIFFLVFIILKYCLGCWGPPRPARPAVILTAALFWCVDLWLVASLRGSTEYHRPSRNLSFVTGGKCSFRSRFLTSPSSHWALRILEFPLTLFFLMVKH